ncbi:hypothetical protein [Marivirga lumbricoides]|uniref:hypothetical protein n=1 Tax=Marivirga lumbricoides TaxID=1046115 RepID=UPI001E45DB96
MKSKAKFWAVTGLIISWTTFWMFLLSPVGLIIWVAILIYLIVKKSHLKWYVIFSAWLFVPGCSFLTSSASYFAGNASLQGIGGPAIFHGVDRETRVASTSSGCLFVGYEPFVFPANNAAIRFWTGIFGYQRGAYTGAFPTEEEAKKLLENAAIIDVKQKGGYYDFALTETAVQLDTADFYRSDYYAAPLDKVAVRALDKECFLFQRIDLEGIGYGPICIVDIENKKLLTRYLDHY